MRKLRVKPFVLRFSHTEGQISEMKAPKVKQQMLTSPNIYLSHCTALYYLLLDLPCLQRACSSAAAQAHVAIVIPRGEYIQGFLSVSRYN